MRAKTLLLGVGLIAVLTFAAPADARMEAEIDAGVAATAGPGMDPARSRPTARQGMTIRRFMASSLRSRLSAVVLKPPTTWSRPGSPGSA